MVTVSARPRAPVGEHLRAGSPVDGLRVRPLEPNADARGSFTEIFAASWESGIVPAQWSVVKSAAGVLRGMHLHRRHDEYFLLVEGRASVGLRDVRPGSPTNGASCLLEFTEKAPAALSFPRGIVHGWYFHEPSIHVQAVSETYPEYREDDNLGCLWSDPDLGIPWPETPRLVSPRAAAFPTLRVLIEETLRRDPRFGA